MSDEERATLRNMFEEGTRPVNKYLWIIESTIEAWSARNTCLTLPGTVFIDEPGGPRGAFLRYVNDALWIDNGPVDVGDYLPQFLGIMDAVKDNNGKVTVFRQGE
jgi:hypothetical protein